MMELSLIRKFKLYLQKKNLKRVSFNMNENDSDIDYIDLRSNDLWCMTFLLLITFDYNFASCYSYNPKQPMVLLNFNKERFINLYKNFCEEFKTDENLIYVCNSLFGMKRFDKGKL